MYKSEFLSRTRHLDIIDETALSLFARDDKGLYNQVSKWARDGFLERISKGRYVLSRKEFGQRISNEALSGRIVLESYVSTLSVLALEMMVPEAATGFAVSCVTCRKPRRFESTVGSFVYRHIKEQAYGGFAVQRDEFDKAYRQATPTKAVLDLLYLDAQKIPPCRDYLEKGLRLQRPEKLSVRELKSYRGVYSKRIDHWIDVLAAFRKEAGR